MTEMQEQTQKTGKPHQRSGYRAMVVIEDENHKPILTFRPGSGNVAKALRVGCEVAIEKCGIDLEAEGIHISD